jgi:hypothetical protein
MHKDELTSIVTALNSISIKAFEYPFTETQSQLRRQGFCKITPLLKVRLKYVVAFFMGFFVRRTEGVLPLP